LSVKTSFLDGGLIMKIVASQKVEKSFFVENL